jgi:hypothetical protein
MTTTTLFSFSTPSGYESYYGLVMDSAGNLFGTTYYGGMDDKGTVFEIERTSSGYASAPVTLADFGSFAGPSNPQGPLVLDAAGDLFGTTYLGGSAGGGTVFEIAKTATGYASTPIALINFEESSVAGPTASLVTDKAGDIFGTFVFGGPSGGGGVFEVVKTATGYAGAPTILAGFSSTMGTPSPLYIDSAGNLFGITLNFGAYASGSVFEIAKTASGYASTPTIIANLSGGEGAVSPTGLIADAAGDLFGITGVGNQVFEITKTASGYSSTPVIVASIPQNDGYALSSPLSIDQAGDLFSTCSDGGPGGYGTVFEIPKAASGYGTPILLQSFNGTNGALPQQSGVILDSMGDLFGTTSSGAVSVGGSVYEIQNTSTGYAATSSTLASLGASPVVDGVIDASPMGGLITDKTGNLFGATYSGGVTGGGSIFEIAKVGSTYASSPISLASVDGFIANTITMDASGNLFGVSSGYGSLFNGSIFEIVKTASGYAGTPTVLTDFSGGATTGYGAVGGLLIDSAGNLFGATSYGGTGGGGTIFEIAKTASGYASMPTALVDFSGVGSSPNGYLIADSAGDLFGTANGGAGGQGWVFEIAKTASGYASSPTSLMSFAGFSPVLGPAVIDAAGDLFGVGITLGSPLDPNPTSTGVIYELVKTAAGYAASPTILATFAGGIDGTSPIGGVIMDAAGNLFGTVTDGGANGLGAVYEIVKTASGYAATPKILMSFDGTDGSDPNGGLVADAKGNLYGTTSLGGANGGGAAFMVADSGYQVPVIQVAAALTAAQNGQLGQSVAISDSASNVTGNLAALQTLASSGEVGAISFTDVTTPAISLSGTQLASDSDAVAAIQSSYSLTVTGSTNVAGLTAVAAADLAGAVSVLDSASAVAASLDSLESVASAGKLGGITLTDSGIPTLSLSASQLSSDAAAIEGISGNFSLSETAPSTSATITGAANALGNKLVFSGSSSVYTITATGDGVHLTVSNGGITDTLSDIQALQFSDVTLIVAQQPGTTAVTTGNIAELYGAAFGRLPDIAGLAYYQQQLAANPSLALPVLAQNFLSSPEYTGNPAHNYAQGAAGDAQFIIDSYANLLHRAPEAGAVAYYQNAINLFTQGLAAGTEAYTQAELQGHAAVLTDFSQSPEFLGDVQVTAKNPASSQHWLLLI